MATQKTYLVISALGEDRPGLVSQLSKVLLDHGCNIEDSRMTVLGGEFAVILLVEGKWNTLAKVENSLPELGRQLGMTIISKRTGPRAVGGNLLPYAVDVISMDHPGIVNNLAGFFSDRGINIEDMATSSYAAAHTGTPMFTVHMTVGIPSSSTSPGCATSSWTTATGSTSTRCWSPSRADRPPRPPPHPTRQATMTLRIGETVPDLEIPATGGRALRLSDFRGKSPGALVLPQGEHPGCTLEGQGFRDAADAFAAAGTAILGASRDSVKAQENFKAKQGFPFELLSDKDEALCRAFDVIKLKKLYGKESLGIERSTFLLDAAGRLRQEWRGVKVKGHVEEVLGAARGLADGS